MRRFRLKGGKYIFGNTYGDLVDMLKNINWTQDENEIVFMKNVSERCCHYSGASIRFSNKRSFIDDLILHGYLTEDIFEPQHDIPNIIKFNEQS